MCHVKPCQFDDATLAAQAASHGLPPGVVRECAEWVTAKAEAGGVVNPNAMLEAALSRRASAMRAAPAAGSAKRGVGEEVCFVGFDPHGQTFRSTQPITNAQTRFVQLAVREIPEQLLTPAEVVWMLSRHPEQVVDAFGHAAVGRWARLDRFDDWRVAAGETGMSACIAGSVRAIDSREPRRFAAMVEDWCRREGQPFPVEVAAEKAESMRGFLPDSVIDRLHAEAARAREQRLAG